MQVCVVQQGTVKGTIKVNKSVLSTTQKSGAASDDASTGPGSSPSVAKVFVLSRSSHSIHLCTALPFRVDVGYSALSLVNINLR